MSRLPTLRPDQLRADQRSLYDAITGGPRASAELTDEHGALRGPFDPLLRVPDLGDVVQTLGATLRYCGSLPNDIRELAILCVASEWCCGVELAVHGPIAEAAGVPEAVVAALRSGDAVELAPGSVGEVVHRAAGELFRDHRLGNDTYDQLIDAIGEAQAVELLVLFGYYTTLAMILETFEIGP